MADDVSLPSLPGPDAGIEDVRAALRQLITWATAREPLAAGGDTEKFVTSGGGAFTGTVQVGRSPQFKGTSMVGSGAKFTPEGPFCVGNARTNITFDGKTLTLNGPLIDDSNLALTDLTASLSGTFSKVTSAAGSHVIGTLTVSASGGTAPYTYAWSISDQGNDLNNGDLLYLTGTLSATTCGLSGYLSSGSPQSVLAFVACLVTDANGRTVTPTHSAILTHT